MIDVKLRVDRYDTLGNGSSFVERQTELESQEWMQFLRKHGSIENIKHYKDVELWQEIWVVTFSLPSKEECFFRLKYATEVEEFSKSS